MNLRYDKAPLGRDRQGRCICNTSMNKDEPRHDRNICECECHQYHGVNSIKYYKPTEKLNQSESNN